MSYWQLDSRELDRQTGRALLVEQIVCRARRENFAKDALRLLQELALLLRPFAPIDVLNKATCVLSFEGFAVSNLVVGLDRQRLDE
jgi:hypothetical protein